MKVIVFGSTGNVGKQLVKQALFDGHEVVAFGRNVFTEGLPENDKKLELVHGALFDAGQVYHAMKGCDAVLSALGGATDGDDKTRSLGIKNIVQQMQKASIKRIVTVGGMGVLDDENGKLLMEGEDFPPQYYAVSQEHLKALETLKSSGLDWTFVCPPMIIDGEAAGSFKTEADHLPTPNNFKITSGDLALFMLSELEKKEFLQQKVGISA